MDVDEAAVAQANCCCECGTDVGPAELARFGGMCRACLAGAEAGLLDLYGFDELEIDRLGAWMLPARSGLPHTGGEVPEGLHSPNLNVLG